MQELQPGQNRPIGSGRVTVGVSGDPSEDFATKTRAAALLLTADGRMHDLQDLISAEQPRSRDGSVACTESGEFCVDLDAVPAAVARIALVLVVKPELGPGVTFGVFASIRSWLADAAGQRLLLFSLPLASRGETAMILAELYRHQGAWKFRAVGQGFAAGLSALAAYFGLQLPESTADAHPLGSPEIRRTPKQSRSPASFSGTGFCIHPEGYILTNHHVIEGAREILARSPRQRCRLEPVFADPANDLALLRSDTPLSGMAVFRTGAPTRLGEAVIVIGYPLGGLLGSGPQVTTGNVSSLIGPGDDTRFLQFTAPIQAGNSGGPLLNDEGAVVGVVSSKLNAVRVHEMTGDIPQNVNFAIKSALACSFLEAIGIEYQSLVPHHARTTADIAAKAREFVFKIECQE